MSCLICQSEKEVRNINLYIIGSEGLDICHACEMGLVHHIHELRRIASMAKLLTYKQMKKKLVSQISE